MLVVGLCGKICSGKKTVAGLLAERLDMKVVALDEIAQGERGFSRSSRATRRKIVEYANSRRAAEGVSHFLARLDLDASVKDVRNGVIVSGVSCVGEARFLNERFGCHLIAVETTNPSVRWERHLVRSGETGDLMTREQFESVEELESAGSHDHEMNVAVVEALARNRIINDGTLEDLGTQLEGLVEELRCLVDAVDFDPSPIPRILSGVVGGHRPKRAGSVIVDSFESNLELERRRVALTYLKRSYMLEELSERERALAPLLTSRHVVHEIGNQFAHRLVDAFLEAEAAVALGEFRTLRASTLDEELALLLNDTEFLHRHAALHSYLAEERASLSDAAVVNLQTAKRNDEIQFRADEVRSSEFVSEQGIELRISRDGVPVIRDAQQQAGRGMFPVLELVKNLRVLEVGGFTGSKVSLAIHDVMDHVWLFDLLDRLGIFQKYAELFNSIGNPEAFDIFRREGEIVASIGFGVRLWANMQIGFVPEYSVQLMMEKMEKDFDDGLLGPMHQEAFVKLRRLARDVSSRESQSLAFVFSNYLVELDEQRRKEGRIKRRDPRTHKVVGELDPWSPDYMAFFIDTHSILLDSHNKHRDTLLRLHLIFEEFLCSEAAINGHPLNLTLRSLAEQDFSVSTLPPVRINWIARNYGFSAFREPVI